MKLLDKVTVNTLKSNERKREIEEGAKLARKIDLLRQTAAKEEANLTKFRTESIANIKLEIDNLIRERDAIQVEVKALEDKNELLKVSLDSEAKQNKQEKERLEKLNDDLVSKQKTIDNELFKISEDIKAFEVENKRLIDLKKEADRIASITNEKAKESEENLAESTKRLNQVAKLFNEGEERQKRKEKDITYRELDVQTNWEFINKEKERLALVEKELEARKASFDEKYLNEQLKYRIKEEKEQNDEDRKEIEKLKEIFQKENEIKQDKLQKMITKNEKTVADKESELIIRESNLKVLSEELKAREQSVKTRESLTENKYNEANLYREKAKEILSEAERQKNEANQTIEKSLKELSEKEKALSNRELDLIIKKDVIDKEFAKINQEKLHIASQQETLRLAWINIKKLQ